MKLISPSEPLDQYSYVESEEEDITTIKTETKNFKQQQKRMASRKITSDSGIGLDCLFGFNYNHLSPSSTTRFVF